MSNKTMKTLTIGGIKYEIVDASARADIQTLLNTQSNIVILKVPVLAEGASDYTEEDKNTIKVAIEEIAAAAKPIIVLDYNDSYIPANYFYRDAHHYFTAILTDQMIQEEGSLYLIRVDYDNVNNILNIEFDFDIGGTSKSLAPVATSGSFNDLKHKPSTVFSVDENGVLSINIIYSNDETEAVVYNMQEDETGITVVQATNATANNNELEVI